MGDRYCSFCAKHESEVKRIIDGPAVGICNECIDLMVGMLKEPPRPAHRSYSEFKADMLDQLGIRKSEA